MIKIGWTVIDYRHCSLTKGRKAELAHFPRRQGSLGMNLETEPPADFLGSRSLDQSFKTENVQCSSQGPPWQTGFEQRLPIHGSEKVRVKSREIFEGLPWAPGIWKRGRRSEDERKFDFVLSYEFWKKLELQFCSAIDTQIHSLN